MTTITKDDLLEILQNPKAARIIQGVGHQFKNAGDMTCFTPSTPPCDMTQGQTKSMESEIVAECCYESPSHFREIG